MAEQEMSRISAIVPGLVGNGVLYADPADYDDVALALLAGGYTVHVVDGRGVTGRAKALAALAGALKLPGAADRNLDALADTLRDLARWCPGESRIALLWRHAEELIDGDKDLWDVLVEILSDSTRALWSGSADDDIAFETIAFAAGHGLARLDLPVPEHDR